MKMNQSSLQDQKCSQTLYFSRTHAQLRRIAQRERAGQPANFMNTTAVVHETWLKLNVSNTAFNDRKHFLSTAALAMRQVLLDYARYSLADKRNPAHEVATSKQNPESRPEQPLGEVADLILDRSSVLGFGALELIAIDQALKQLSEIDGALADFVILKFFAGLTLDEVADVQNICVRTASHQWHRARAMLRVLLKDV